MHQARVNSLGHRPTVEEDESVPLRLLQALVAQAQRNEVQVESTFFLFIGLISNQTLSSQGQLAPPPPSNNTQRGALYTYSQLAPSPPGACRCPVGGTLTCSLPRRRPPSHTPPSPPTGRCAMQAQRQQQGFKLKASLSFFHNQTLKPGGAFKSG